MRQIVSSSSVECKTQFFFFSFSCPQGCRPGTWRVNLEDFGYELDANQIKSNHLPVTVTLPYATYIPRKKKGFQKIQLRFLSKITIWCVLGWLYHR